MPRAIEADVAAIVKVREGDSLTPFLEAADEIITNYVAVTDPPPAAKNMAIVCQWLAAHLYSQFRRRLASGSAGDVSETYEGQTGLYLEGTTYGQQAMLLDASGALSTLNAAAKAGRNKTYVKWLGQHRDGGPAVRDDG